MKNKKKSGVPLNISIKILEVAKFQDRMYVLRFLDKMEMHTYSY